MIRHRAGRIGQRGADAEAVDENASILECLPLEHL